MRWAFRLLAGVAALIAALALLAYGPGSMDAQRFDPSPPAPRLEALFSDAAEPELREVLLALNATVEGQTTAHYITERLAGLPVEVSRLAHGVPVGGELDYLDDGTLAAAMKSRTGM
jgi:recombinational DNA repair protein RecR